MLVYEDLDDVFKPKTKEEIVDTIFTRDTNTFDKRAVEKIDQALTPEQFLDYFKQQKFKNMHSNLQKYQVNDSDLFFYLIKNISLTKDEKLLKKVFEKTDNNLLSKWLLRMPRHYSKLMVKNFGADTLVNLFLFLPNGADIIKNIALRTDDQKLASYAQNLNTRKLHTKSKYTRGYDIHAYQGQETAMKFQKGYILFRILDFLDKNPEGVRRKDLTKFVFELRYGKGKGTKSKIAGYYSNTFKNYRDEYNYIFNDEEGRWYITNQGKEKLNQLRQKFKLEESVFKPLSQNQYRERFEQLKYEDYEDLVLKSGRDLGNDNMYLQVEDIQEVWAAFKAKISPREIAKKILNQHFKPRGASIDGRLLINYIDRDDMIEYKYIKDKYPRTAEIIWEYTNDENDIESIEELEIDQEASPYFETDQGERFLMSEIMRL
jgi:hypothetical protein